MESFRAKWAVGIVTLIGLALMGATALVVSLLISSILGWLASLTHLVSYPDAQKVAAVVVLAALLPYYVGAAMPALSSATVSLPAAMRASKRR